MWRKNESWLAERALDPCIICMELHEDDIPRGCLLIIMQTNHNFHEINITMPALGMHVWFDITCEDPTVPVVLFTMEASLRRMALDDCQPTCGPITRCDPQMTLDDPMTPGWDQHVFNCDCGPPCQDVAIHIPQSSFTFADKTMQICHPFETP